MDHVTNGALCGRLYVKVRGPHLPIFNKNPSTLGPIPLPPNLRNTSDPAPRKRKRLLSPDIWPDTPRKKHRKLMKPPRILVNCAMSPKLETMSLTKRPKLGPHNVKTLGIKRTTSQMALCVVGHYLWKYLAAYPSFSKISIPRTLGTRRKKSQTCPPSLDRKSLSVTRQIEFNLSTFPLPLDSQNTSDLPKPIKRQASVDTQRKKHRGINEATVTSESWQINIQPFILYILLQPQNYIVSCSCRQVHVLVILATLAALTNYCGYCKIYVSGSTLCLWSRLYSQVFRFWRSLRLFSEHWDQLEMSFTQGLLRVA